MIDVIEDYKITGSHIYYLFVCKRKLWFFHHGIRPEKEDINVQIGRHIQETAFERHEKDISIGEVGVIDWALFKDGIIHETKKNRTPKKGDFAQVKFYMWWMNLHSINIKEGRIHYPKLKRTEIIEWSDQISPEVEKYVKKCKTILDMKKPPPIKKYPYCKSCAYQEICFV